jgi:hypothetical protein
MVGSLPEMLAYVSRHYTDSFNGLLKLFSIDAQLLRPISHFVFLMDVDADAVLAATVI